MYKCKKCGELNEDIDKFCKNCGVYIGEPLVQKEILKESILEEKAAGVEEGLIIVHKNIKPGKLYNGYIKFVNCIFEMLKSIINPYFFKEKINLFYLISYAAVCSALFSLTIFLGIYFKIISNYEMGMIGRIFWSSDFITQSGRDVLLNSFILFLGSTIILFCISYLLCFYIFKKDCGLKKLYYNIIKCYSSLILGSAAFILLKDIKIISYIILFIYLIQFILLFKDTIENNFEIKGFKAIYLIPVIIFINSAFIWLYVKLFMM